MKAADGNRLVSVINASRRGLGLRGRNLPSRGEYVEIRLQEGVVVGRVAWSNGVRCGIQTQDAVELRALTDIPVQRNGSEAEAGGMRPAERSGAPRQELVFEASRSSGRMMQFGFVAMLVFGAGVYAAEAVRSALAAPLHAAEATLARNSAR